MSPRIAASRFVARFGVPPVSVSVAPGRVNLIGEHVDYHDLPVLPMALTRGVRIAFRPRADAEVRVANASPDFPDRFFVLDGEIERGPPGDWGNYLKAAARVAVEHGAHRGVDAMLDSTLPPAAGLSSSAALVVATARALLSASGLTVDPLVLAGDLARGERFVGTEGGGMDQAVCLGAHAGHALHIDFAPLRWTSIPVPRDWRIVIAHSGVVAEKSGQAQAAYNDRRRSGESARRVVAAAVGDKGASYRELLATVPDGVLLDRGAHLLEPRLLHRFRHVVTEARRVAAAEKALVEADLTGFGALLVASHASLRDDYEVSHPRLDALVDAALAGGAAGARLTGAGFGGCMLAVCDRARLEAVHDALRRTLTDSGIPLAEAVVFAAEAGEGAHVRWAAV